MFFIIIPPFPTPLLLLYIAHSCLHPAQSTDVLISVNDDTCTAASHWLESMQAGGGTRLLVAAVLIIPQAGLVWDNGVIAAGSLIGIGDTLKALSWPRFWIHWIFGAWLIIGCGAILRLAGVRWAQTRAGMLAFCVLTAALMIYDLPHFFRDQLHPVCEKGMVRYSTVVTADRLCFEGQALTPRDAPPYASIIACLVVIACGVVLLIRRRFIWMLLGGVVMLLSAAPPGMKLKLDNLGEVFITGGVIWALATLTRGRARQPLSRDSTRLA